ncbi:ABC transporter permease [Vagococcus sp. BWB3-3]|uniref:ABC transporter permease n=1 Tax=Vagococcus allomyrinae TaxID=2794353 RepID=A0A940SX77_9ENTE|nr:ABC transporter permease [Vagococcus allomyrinae]MBP1042971.1 ABC transporter permease [Vagococcus allomyrinae]
MNKFWVVALETYKRNVKSVTFIVMILAPFLMVGFSLLMGLVGSNFEKVSNIAVVSKNELIREAFITQTDFDVNKKIDTEEAAKKALEEEKIDGFLVIDTDAEGSQLSGEYFGDTSLGTTDEMGITQILTGIQVGFLSQELNLSAEDIQKLSQPAALATKTVEFKDGKMTDKGVNRIVMTISSVFIGLAMYMIILMYAQVTSSEVASEKGTRIMEIILSSTSAAKHFYGKVMGIFMVILTQVVVYFGIGLGAFLFMKDTDMVKDVLKVVSIREIIKSLLGYNLIYLLLGVVIYTILSAFCGSLVSKSEDAGKAVAPVTYLTMIGFFLTMIFGMSDPQHILMRVTSYIPFLSSFTMPSRIASGTVTDMGVIISLLILVVSTLVLLKISASMYRSTALVYSDDGMWKALKKSMSIMKSEKR